MLYTNIDESSGIAMMTADGPLEKQDFVSSTKAFKEYTDRYGLTKGIIVYTEYFPGWKSIGVIPHHLRYAVKNRSKTRKIAIVTKFKAPLILQLAASLLYGRPTRLFGYDQMSLARKWIEK